MTGEFVSLIISVVGVVLSAVVGFIAAANKLGKYEEKVNGLEKKVGELEAETKSISMKLTECSTKLDERTQSYASTLTKRKSPVSLTDKGEYLLKRSESDVFVLENQKELVEKIKDKNPKSAYDVQILAKEVIESLQNEDRFTKFKDFAFKEGIELDAIFIVMSLYLRDIAIPLLGFKIEEIDKTDPKNETEQLQ